MSSVHAPYTDDSAAFARLSILYPPRPYPQDVPSAAPRADFTMTNVDCQGSEASLSVCQHQLRTSPCTARVDVTCTCDSPDNLVVFDSSSTTGGFSPTAGYYQRNANADSAGWPEYRQVAAIGLDPPRSGAAKIRFLPVEAGSETGLVGQWQIESSSGEVVASIDAPALGSALGAAVCTRLTSTGWRARRTDLPLVVRESLPGKEHFSCLLQPRTRVRHRHHRFSI